MDRAPDSKSGCWGFKSLLACHIYLMRCRQSAFSGFGVMDKLKHAFEKVTQFLKDAKGELKKVTWPQPRQAAASTAVVVIVVVVVSLFLGIVDFGVAKLIRFVLG
jgi:preprotein translocase subunit SecE